MIPYKQLSLADSFQDCNENYALTGRTRKYPLKAFLWALIIQRIFSIHTDQLLLTFLAYSKPLRNFCGFLSS